MKIIGHRGAKGLAPENTLASFKKATQHNVDEIECDVRVTKDGVAILEHDEYLHNRAGESLRVADYNYAELLKHKPDLATLEQAITAVGRTVPLYLEVKPGEPTDPIIACVNRFLKKGWQPTDFHIASFDYKVLQQLHAALPTVQPIVLESWSGVRATRRARRLGTKRISMNQRWLWSGFIRMVSRQGWQLSTYTLNDPHKARRWQRYGLFAVVTDVPDVFEAATLDT